MSPDRAWMLVIALAAAAVVVVWLGLKLLVWWVTRD